MKTLKPRHSTRKRSPAQYAVLENQLTIDNMRALALAIRDALTVHVGTPITSARRAAIHAQVSSRVQQLEREGTIPPAVVTAIVRTNGDVDVALVRTKTVLFTITRTKAVLFT